MKPFALIFLWIGTITVSFSQEKGLLGTWNITESAYKTETRVIKNFEKEIAEGKAITTFSFMENGTFKEITNMTGTNDFEAYNGIWEIDGSGLTITIQTNKGKMKFTYNYTLKENILILDNPVGSGTFISTFKKELK
jgi:hypothetical protein